MILDRILEQKRREVEALRARFADWRPPETPPRRRDFRAALQAGPGQIALIAEFKRRSPSKGDLGADRDPAAQARAYARAGAAAMSVLCDEQFFGGRLEDLVAARNAADLPVMRKDFLIDPCQLAESAGVKGPDAVL